MGLAEHRIYFDTICPYCGKKSIFSSEPPYDHNGLFNNEGQMLMRTTLSNCRTRCERNCLGAIGCLSFIVIGILITPRSTGFSFENNKNEYVGCE